MPHSKHNVYRDIVVTFLKTKKIFIDRILTCSVQYIKSDSNKLYSFMLLRYQFNTENKFLVKKEKNVKVYKKMYVCCMVNKV